MQLISPQQCEGVIINSSLADLLGIDQWRDKIIAAFPRNLKGDFNGLARKIAEYIKLKPDEQIELAGFPTNKLMSAETALYAVFPILTDEEIIAAQQVLRDMRQTEHFQMVLNIEGSEFQQQTLTKLWHHDADWKQGRILCAYNVAATEGLHPDDAKYEGGDFYSAVKNARIFNFGLGAITRHKVVRESEKLGRVYVHRRPEIYMDTPPRLLLQSLA